MCSINYDCFLLFQLSSLKVADLKEYLKYIGLRTTGKKQELIDSITSHFELATESI